MRVACLISGQPRFCKSFDKQLQNLHSDSEIDWFVNIWNHSEQPPDRISMPPALLNTDSERAADYIRNRLPPGHRLVDLAAVNQPSTEHVTERNYYHIGWPKPETIYLTYYGVYLVNQLKLKHELTHGKYDLVIRTRPDLAPDRTIHLPTVYEFIKQNPPLVITPRNERHGEGPSNDQFAIGSSSAIDVYADIFNKLDEIHNSGVEYGPETLLYHHLRRSNIRDCIGNFMVRLREFSRTENGITTMDLGTWA